MSWSVKKMGDTRREREAKVSRTFGPLYALVAQLETGEVDAVRGHPVIEAWGEYMRVDQVLAEVRRCFDRIAPHADWRAFDAVGKRLGNGVPITEDDVETLRNTIKQAEAVYRTTPLDYLKAMIRTELIAIELDAIREAA